MTTIISESPNTPVQFIPGSDQQSEKIHIKPLHDEFMVTKTGTSNFKSVYQQVCFDWDSFTSYHEFE